MTPANQIQPSTQLAPLANMAPLKPLMELQRGGKKPGSYVAKAMQERFKHFHHKDRDVFREIVNVGQLTSLYINGKQFLARNPYDGSWGVLPISGNDDSSRRALNVMNSLKQNLLAKWEGANPDILIRPGRNLDTCASAAKSADAIMNYYEREFYNTHFSQQEALMGMTFGTYIDRYRFDDTKISMSVLQDIFETKDASMGEGFGFCGDCQYGGAAKDFESPPNQEELGQLGGLGPLASGQACPKCNSSAVIVEGPATDSIHSMTGQQTRQIGDLVCELLPMPACRWDLAKRPEDSSWFIYRQQISKGAITRVLGNVLLPQGDGEHDHGLEVLRALGHSGQALSGFSNYGNQRRSADDEKSEDCTFDEMWLGPDDYSDINLIGDEKTVSGESLPKGRLIDYFPDGLCAVGLNGMAVVLALYPEKHKNHVVSGTWFAQAQTGSGRGLADSVEIQKQFNTLNNQALAYMSSTYTPAVMYNNQILTGNKMKYIGTPKTNIPVDLTKLPEGQKLSDAIHQFTPSSMPAQFFDYAQNFLNVMFQKTSMVTDFSNGEPGITSTNTTATAAEIDQGNADSINQPIFMVKADARKRGAEITIKLFREHFPVKRYFDLGGQYGQMQGVELSGADLKADLVFEVVRNSEMPKGPYSRQKNVMSFFNVVGGAQGYAMIKQADPRLTNELENVFDVDLETDTFDSVAELCRRRLDQMKQAVQVGVSDPLIIIQAIEPPIDEAELHLPEKAKWFAECLDWDELQDAPMPLRQACSLLAKGQMIGAIQQESAMAMGQGAVAVAGQAPEAMGQQALDAQNQPEQPQEPSPDQQLNAQTQMQQNEVDSANQESAQAHEASESEKQRQHELKTKRIDVTLKNKEHANKIAVAKMKPKPKPAAKGKAK